MMSFKKTVFWLGCLLWVCQHVFAAPPPELPGTELQETQRSIQRMQEQVEPLQENKADSSVWMAPTIAEQLGRDKTLIGMGQGAVFAPAMTESRVEPEVIILQGDSIVARGLHGHRVLVKAGEYLVQVGSGNRSQKLEYAVEVKEGHTTIIEPDWSAMVVETLDENHGFIEEVYEVFDLNTGESFGKGYGKDEERRADIRTWLLPPGMYKITRSDKDFSTTTDYITVQINKGQLSFIEMVFDSQTSAVLGGGAIASKSRGRDNSNWRFILRMGGAVSYGSTYALEDKEKSEDVVTMLSDIAFTARYDDSKWLGISELISKNNFQWENDHESKEETALRSTIDDFQFRTTVVRRITPWIGPYVRGTWKTHLFPVVETIDEGEPLYVLNANEDTIATYKDTLQIRPRFFPMEFGEGAGVNMQLISNYSIESNAKFGAAWRQYLNDDVLIVLNDTSNAYLYAENENEFGLESSFFLRLKWSRWVSLDMLAELFFPDANFEQPRIEELSADLRLKLIRNVELSYLQEILDEETEEGEILYYSRNSFTLRYFLNF